jgi:hypothetical protein
MLHDTRRSTHANRMERPELRLPTNELAGFLMLGREIDKARSHLSGFEPEPLLENERDFESAFFGGVNIEPRDLLDAVRSTWRLCLARNNVALADLRESLENEPEISDATFMDHAQASDIDRLVAEWITHELSGDRDAIARTNARIRSVNLSG